MRAQRNAGGPAFLRCPNVQNTGSDQATVVWTLPGLHAASVAVTDPSGKVRVFEASSSRFDASATGMDQTYYQYRATLTGLERATSYSYKILADGAELRAPLRRALQFRTEAPGPFRFLHFADSGEGNSQQNQLGQEMLAEDATFVLANGDLAYDWATHASVEDNYYSVYREIMAQIPFFATLGNHEYYADKGAPSLAARAHRIDGVAPHDWGRYYSFDWGNAHFVALDSNLPLELAAEGRGEMLRWLDQDLRNTRKFWRIVFFHHPGFATGKHENSAEAARVREHIVPILEAHGVQLVFNGHEHTYQRTHELRGGQVVPNDSGGIVYVTSGGGGAQAFWSAPNERIAQSIGKNHFVRTDVAGMSLVMRARGLGEEQDLDSATLRPKPRITAVVNSAAFTPAVASGGAVTLFGWNLFPETVSTGASFTEAHGCSVQLNGAALPLLFGDAMQINLQLPAGVSGAAKLRVVTPNGAAEVEVQISPVAPALFANPQAPEIVLATRGAALVDAQGPVRGGDEVSLFATGLGECGASLVRVNVGGVETGASSVVQQGGGIAQIRFAMPAGVKPASATVHIMADGVRSNALTLPVR